MPPVPILRVALSVPESVMVLDIVRVLDVVPPAIRNPVVNAVSVRPLTVLGVIAPSVIVIAGVVVEFVILAEIPLAVTTETVVTVPVPVTVMNSRAVSPEFTRGILPAWPVYD